jgi:hypothetical protein
MFLSRSFFEIVPIVILSNGLYVLDFVFEYDMVGLIFIVCTVSTSFNFRVSLVFIDNFVWETLYERGSYENWIIVKTSWCVRMNKN